MPVTVRMYETYDMSTAKDKLGLIAIRTPSMPYIEKRYPGLIRQFKYVHLDKVDVVLSCASSLPADPLQIGTQAGKIAPQDMFNPLLYSAISNDGWNGVVNRIYGSQGSTTSQSGAVREFQPAFDGLTSNGEALKVYYSLLAETRFRKAYVQSGLNMKGLVPLVYPVLTPNGQNAQLQGLNVPTMSNFNDVMAMSKAGDTGTTALERSPLIKGAAQRLPRLQTKTYMYHQGDDTVVNVTPSVMLGGIPTCVCGVIVVPPASLNITYFRMTVCWQVTFSGLQSDSEIGGIPLLKDLGSGWVYSNYSQAQQTSLKAEDLADYSDTAVSADDGDIQRSVVADGVTLDLVMEK